MPVLAFALTFSILFGSCVRADAEQENLITNGSFELWSNGPTSDPDGWTRLLDLGIVERAGSIKHSGTYSARYTKTESNVNAYQDIPDYTAYQAITCSGWVLAQKPNTIRIVVNDGNQASCSAWSSSGSWWEQLKVTHVLSENASQLRVVFDVSGASPSQTIAGTYGYFDDVECRKANVPLSAVLHELNAKYGIYKILLNVLIVLLLIATVVVWRNFPRFAGLVSLRLLVVVPALLLAAWYIGLFREFRVDDAYITFQYARNLAIGNGLVWNKDLAPSEGYTNSLWVVANALPIVGGIDPLVFAKIVGLVFTLAAVILLPSLSKAITGNRNAGPIAASLAFATPAVWLWGLSGLETGLLLFLVVLSVVLVVREDVEVSNVPVGHGHWSSVSFLALALTRADGVVYFLAIALLRLLVAWRDDIFRERIANLLVWATMFAVPYLLYLIWKGLYYGDLLPNSAYLKGMNPLSVSLLDYAVPFLVMMSPLFVFSIFGALKKTPATWYCAGILAANLLTYSGSTDWMPGFRLLLPSFMMLAVLAEGGIWQAMRMAPTANPLDKNTSLPYGGFMTAALLLPLLASQLVFSSPGETTYSFATTSNKAALLKFARVHTAIVEDLVRAGTLLRANAPVGVHIRVDSVGAIGYFSDRSTFDVLGLVDKKVLLVPREERNERIFKLDSDYLVLESGWQGAYTGSLEPWFSDKRFRLVQTIQSASPILHAVWIYKRASP